MRLNLFWPSVVLCFVLNWFIWDCFFCRKDVFFFLSRMHQLRFLPELVFGRKDTNTKSLYFSRHWCKTNTTQQNRTNEWTPFGRIFRGNLMPSVSFFLHLSLSFTLSSYTTRTHLVIVPSLLCAHPLFLLLSLCHVLKHTNSRGHLLFCHLLAPTHTLACLNSSAHTHHCPNTYTMVHQRTQTQQWHLHARTHANTQTRTNSFLPTKTNTTMTHTPTHTHTQTRSYKQKQTQSKVSFSLDVIITHKALIWLHGGPTMTQQLILLSVFNQTSLHRRQRSQKLNLRLKSTMEELGNKRIKKVLSYLFLVSLTYNL